MIDKKKARELMRAFSGMPQTPAKPEDIDLRSAALAARAGSNQHAEAVVSALVERLTFFPTVGDIVQACINTLDPCGPEALAKSRSCQWCNGDGFRSLEGEFGTSGAYPCDHKGTGPGSTMGVRITPSVAQHYAEEERGALRRIEYAPDLDTAFKRPAEALLRMRADVSRAMEERRNRLAQEELDGAA